jgi:prefoldin alpha subunit
MEKEEIIYKLSMFEQQAQQIQQQVQMIENGIVELTNLKIGIEELKGKKEQEIMAPIGSGVFVKAKLLSEDLIVDIGGKNFIKKGIPETKNMIEEQIKRLEEVRIDLSNSLEGINVQVSEMINNFQKENQEDLESDRKIND